MRVNKTALRTFREHAGLSRVRLAEATGGQVTPEAIRLIEQGKTTNPRPDTVKAIADALGISVGAVVIPEPDFEEAA